tara:strand:+ start:34608 stop:35045 length:438 start_codon:yes stop_codon:yes gene_type:complete
MKIRRKKMNKRHYNLINFNHLMKIYEFNYQLINKLFSFNFRSKKLSTFILHKQVLQYEPISISKYTSIFKLYYKFTNNTSCLREYHIKPHLIFTLYNDAKLLEAKTLKQSKEFESSLGDKIKTNVDIFLWLNLFNKKTLNINDIQ